MWWKDNHSKALKLSLMSHIMLAKFGLWIEILPLAQSIAILESPKACNLVIFFPLSFLKESRVLSVLLYCLSRL
jgi:hypothetical protein